VTRFNLGVWTIPTFLVLVAVVSLVRADEPLAPPERYELQSASHKYVATLDPKTGVAVRAAGSTNLLWTSTNWFRVAFLGDDGDHFVTGYDGMNLIPQNYPRDLALITFWRRGEKIRSVNVGELFPDPRVLTRTVSHFHWGSITGLTNSTLTVLRCDGKTARFDVNTGRVKK
jgi:hypothetical protein